MDLDFWDKVAEGPDDRCWEWQGSRSPRGYGWHRGRAAHRVAYELAFGPIPPGLHVLHHCDNPPCVNPLHLWVGNHAANMADMKTKGRQRNGARSGRMSRGKAHWKARLTEARVLELRARFAAGTPLRGLARENPTVSLSAIRRAVRGRSWAHLPNYVPPP